MLTTITRKEKGGRKTEKKERKKEREKERANDTPENFPRGTISYLILYPKRAGFATLKPNPTFNLGENGGRKPGT